MHDGLGQLNNRNVRLLYFCVSVKMNLDIEMIRYLMIFSAAIFSGIAIFMSTWLIFQHQRHFTNRPVQSKITGILWMVPIYSIDSFISLVFPSFAVRYPIDK